VQEIEPRLDHHRCHDAGRMPSARFAVSANVQLDGFGLLNALKQDKQLAMLPVIML